MDRKEERIHRTWVQLLLDNGYTDIAAIALDCEVVFNKNESGYIWGLTVAVPTSVYFFVDKDKQLRDTMYETLAEVSRGNILDPDGTIAEPTGINFTVKLTEVESDWREMVRSLIANDKEPNQGFITEKVFARRGREPYLYNEMKFGSQAEIRIAQEFESRKILFFPLPLAVRQQTGVLWKDHREVDFLVCHEGIWGILEVSRHQNRYEKDAEKDVWFQKSGILCVRHYPAERCYKNSAEVVDEFLMILGKHKR